MKKLLLFVFCLSVCGFSAAQDTLFWQSGEELKVKVVEVSESNIKYQKFDNLQGPVYTVSVDKVARIVYENGDEDKFEAVTTSVSTGVIKYEDDVPVSYNGEPIDELKWMEIAQKNCTPAYSQYMNGRNMKKAGTIMMSVGAPLTAVGTVLMICGGVGVSSDCIVAGSVIFGVGLPVLGGGIPLYCVGKYKKRSSYETFNKCSQPKAQTTLQLNLNSNGVGLALGF